MEKKEENFEVIGLEDKFLCDICKKLLVDPHFCGCRITFCFEHSTAEKCPKCGEEGIMPNKQLSSKINLLKIKCKICKEEMSFSSFKIHPQNWEEHEGECSGCKKFKDKNGKLSLHQTECSPFLSLQNCDLKKEVLSLKLQLEQKGKEIQKFAEKLNQEKEKIMRLEEEQRKDKEELRKDKEKINLLEEEQRKDKERINLLEDEIRKEELKKLEDKRKEKKEKWNFDSLIVNFEQKKQLCEWFFKENKKPILLYRGSRDGFTANDFHRLCDNKGPTLTIVKSKKENIFGGFTSLKWGSAHYKTDPTAKIFSLVGPCGITCCSPTLKPENAVYMNNNYGPTFGGGSGSDLGVFYGGKYGYSNCSNKNVYSVQKGTNLDGAENNFEISEVEVFQI